MQNNALLLHIWTNHSGGSLALSIINLGRPFFRGLNHEGHEVARR